MADQPTPKPSRERVVRVFVSSTFKDMHAEREELVKHVFPQLRHMCEERGVAFVGVDLRWGITDEQAAEGQVLPICLEEIDRCRPFFIGLLGERYGSVPQDIPDELIEQWPWLAEHRSRSMIELEIVHGVLRDPAMADRASFYFRDPAYVASVPPRQCADFAEPDPEKQARLAALKETVRRSGLPLEDGYRDPQQLGELALHHLTEAIDAEYPPDEPSSPLDREAAEHDEFAQSRARVYIGRQEYFERLDAHTAGDGPPLVVLGESGVGKSALLANWGLQRRAEHPEELVIMHFIGASPYSADWAAMVRRIMGELERRFVIEQDIPDNPHELRAAFTNLLHMAAANGRVVLILDALNQLEDRDGAQDLVWFPPVIPENIRLVVSTLPGHPLDDITRRGWATLVVEPLCVDERERLIVAYLAQYRKALTRAQAERIASALQTANPLYLRALLEELRVFGVYDRLDERIDHYLAADTIPALYERILARWEQDYERDHPGLVRDAMTYLWAARRGLSEAELLDILGSGDKPMPPAWWSPLYLAASHALVTRSGLVGFFHDHLRRAVGQRYVATEAEKQSAHLQLADFFDATGPGQRKLDELLWQLAEANSWQRLRAYLMDVQFLRAAWDSNAVDVETCWARAEAMSDVPRVDAYRPVVQAPWRYPLEHVWAVERLLHVAGHVQESLLLQRCLVERADEVGDQLNLAASLVNLAFSTRDYGDLQEAMRLIRDAERICRKEASVAPFAECLAECLGCRGSILRRWGRLQEAMAAFREQEHICRHLGLLLGFAHALGNLALVLRDQGDRHGAMTLRKEEERVYRELGNLEGVEVSLGNQAVLLRELGRIAEAMAVHKEEERVCRALGKKLDLAACLGNQAVLLRQLGDPDGALALHAAEERVWRELGDGYGLQVCLRARADALARQGNLHDALCLCKEAEAICRQLGFEWELAGCLNNMGLFLARQHQLDAAMAALREAEGINRRVGNKVGLCATLGNLGYVACLQGEPDRAMALMKEQEVLCRELGDRTNLQRCLSSQAQLRADRADLEGALALHMEAERICRDLEDWGELAMTLLRQASLLLYDYNEPKQALPKCSEAIRILRETRTGLGVIKDAEALLEKIRGRV